MPEPENPVMPAGPSTLALLLGAFLACAILIIVGLSRDPVLHYRPKQVLQPDVDPARTKWTATVLPFDDAKTDYQYSSIETQKVTPEAIRHDAGDLVCQLGAKTNHFGQLDGEALARAFALHLDETGLYLEAHYKKPKEEFTTLRFSFRGRVNEATMRISPNGVREYVIDLDLMAYAQYGDVWPTENSHIYWQKRLHLRKRAGGRPVAYELNDLLTELYNEATKDLGEGMKRPILGPAG